MQLGATGSQSSLGGEMRSSLSSAVCLGSDVLMADGVPGAVVHVRPSGQGHKALFVMGGTLMQSTFTVTQSSQKSARVRQWYFWHHHRPNIPFQTDYA